MPDRNAAIWYARDGYDPASGGLNGRRVAGASFLKGFFRHADVTEYVSITIGEKSAKEFLSQKTSHNTSLPYRAVFENDLTKLHPVGTIYYPAPNIAEQLWRRQAYGMQHHSICGITHTTATQAIMRGILDLRAGPQAPWDGIICTSHAVHAATLRNIEIADEFLRARFGTVPPRPQMPVIPLGINCDDFTHDPAARAALRKRMGWAKSDIAVVTISRLLPYGKFDPGPLFIALQQAQTALGRKRRLHFIACGLYGDRHSENVFNDCAKALMPDVSFHHLPGDDPVARKQTLSGGDIFAFPIDNVQETFGLAPIEGMAAGLPVVVSDWDGMRDTVTHDVGFRAPSYFASAHATQPEAKGYLSGSLSYAQYGNRLSMVTEISIAKMTEAFVTLASDHALRQKMGKAAQARAEQIYDWRVVVPQMQDFWQELAAIRKSAVKTMAPTNRVNPVGALPGDLFSSYPTGRYDRDNVRIVWTGRTEQLANLFKIRRFAQIGQPAEKRETLTRIADALARHGAKGITINGLATAEKLNPNTVERSVLFFLKYALATSAPGINAPKDKPIG
ncbi:glycosyltransferase [Rhodobacterales bacterium LSUCC0031]|nr:glycosyltransferase [Rhodobacterales bacterium LSUCC0031]